MLKQGTGITPGHGAQASLHIIGKIHYVEGDNQQSNKPLAKVGEVFFSTAAHLGGRPLVIGVGLGARIGDTDIH